MATDHAMHTVNPVTTRIAPIKFRPLLKKRIWGGKRIIPFKNIDVPLAEYGESWEISGLKGDETVVSEGPYAGLRTSQLIDRLKWRLVGRGNYQRHGNRFPMLIKFIDADKDLSIQVHPDDAMAHKYGFPNGKNEMWYVVDVAPGAHIISGFSSQITPEEYEASVADDTIMTLFKDHDVKAGDCFFIPAGRVHSIGAGSFVIEIQQACDITYRIYDFNRRDANGNKRELHTELAKEAIKYDVRRNYLTAYSDERNKRIILVEKSPFTTSLYNLDKPITIDYSRSNHFEVYIAFRGDAEIADDGGNVVSLRAGESLLIPAETSFIKVYPGHEGLGFLEAHT